jgi:hypothetical protein
MDRTMGVNAQTHGEQTEGSQTKVLWHARRGVDRDDRLAQLLLERRREADAREVRTHLPPSQGTG